jgi:predicted nucleotidyltransferase
MDAELRAILGELRDRLQCIYAERLVHLVLYGSRARGDAQAGSDIDVLVVLEGDVSPCEEIARTSEDVARASLAHNVSIACAFVSEEQFAREQSPLLLNVRREGVSV